MASRIVTEPLVYLNGRMLPASDACLKIYDAGVVLGATVTEQLRTFHQRLYKLDEHLDRLFRSLRYMRLPVALTKQEWAAVAHELVAHHAGLLADGAELGLICFVTAGEYAAYASPLTLPSLPSPGGEGRVRGADPTVCVHTFVLPFERWARTLQTGAHLVTPSVRHVPPQCYDPKMKYRSRIHFYLADKEAQLVDPDAAALLLDLHGNVTETATANLLIVERGRVVSPPPVNILPGISRATVIELASKMGIPYHERDLQVFDVLNADEAFTTSTPYCLLPVTKINGVAIGEGKPGPVWRRFMEAWSQEVRLDIAQQILDGAKRRATAILGQQSP
jgi:branched-subunit amino acid aminotransferase/4-amino-4-deoxychorismate lyase